MKQTAIGRAVAAVFIGMALLLLTACGGADTPEQAIKNFNTKMNDCNYKAAFSYVSDYDGLSFDKGDRSGTKQIVNAVSKTLEIEIVDIQTSGATGAATLKVTTVDLRDIYTRAAATVTNNYVDTVLEGSKISAEDMRDALVAEIVRESALSDAQKVTTDCKVNLSREKDRWFMILDKTSFNVMMGYIDDANTMVESGDFSNISVESSDTESESETENTVESETEDDSTESAVFND